MSTNLAQLIAHGFAKLTGAQRQAGATQPLAATASNVVVLPSGDQLTKAHVGLPSADNTSDANKPVSTAQQTALDFKLNAANPSYTGTLTGGTGIVNLGSGQFVKDAAGNVGLGVTPSAWGGGKGFQVEKASVFGVASLGGFASNLYLADAGANYRCIANGTVALYLQNAAGDHRWLVGSGTAGNTVSPTTAMTLDASGALRVQEVGNSNGTMQLGGTSFYGTIKHDASVTGANIYNVASASGGGHIFQRGGTTQFMTDTAGNLNVNTGSLGYGTGAGGTVTQVTSKATAVTLNKPSGTVTMHNASLAAGASVLFALNNTFFATTDTVVLTGQSWSIFYRIETANSDTGQIGIRVTNTESVSRSDPLAFSFAIVKGATA